MSNVDEFEEVRDSQRTARQEQQLRLARLRSAWARMRPIPAEIKCKFLEPEPLKSEQKEIEVEVTIGDQVLKNSVGKMVRSDQDGRTIFDPEVKRLGYRGAVEKWALWKWHTARGTPVDERDHYETEPGYQPPKFVWEEAEIPVRRGRPPKE